MSKYDAYGNIVYDNTYTQVGVNTIKGSKSVKTVVVGTTPTLLIGPNPNRKTLVMANNGTNTIFISGQPNVSINDGFPFPEGAYLSDDNSVDAWYGVVASGTGDFRFIDIF